MNRIKNSLAAFGGLSLVISLILTSNFARAQAVNITPGSVLLAVAPAAAVGTQDSQVVLGTTEADSKFTWVVHTLALGGGLTCKGVLIAPRWVLTAAHCVGSNFNGGGVSYSRKDPLTGVTTGGRQETGLMSTFKHPEFRLGFPDNDIALVRLPKPFDPDPLLQPAELPTAAAAVGQRGTIANFSHTTTLPAGQVAVLRAPILFAGGKSFSARSTTASLCSGDSGSGFMTLRAGLNVVTGIASQAVIGDCATANLEFDAVDVFQHLSWIRSITGSLLSNTKPAHCVPRDYDGDGKIDLALKTSLGDWKIDYANNGFGFWDVSYPGYGKDHLAPDHIAVPADYDGDGKADLSVKSNGSGSWNIDYAANGFGRWDVSYPGYGFTDAPVPADYDGDGKADLSVKTRGGTWFIDYASDGFGLPNVSYSGYGFSDAHPVPADYDGDGKADLSVKTDAGKWFIDYASDGFGRWNVSYSGYGGTDAAPIPADYNGDGKADLSVKANDGRWYIDFAAPRLIGNLATISSTGFGSWNVSYPGWGGSTFFAVPRDYDGDHRLDLAVYNRLNDSWHIDYAEDGFGDANEVISEAP
ncbi:MAG: trypsin-like serine protease [Acidobacteria bacterium]|nr:trypsin-like serine protease [Acidobacteriota bacterium]MCI0720930.1 trypsin-like serine protease [Acidobacteriota bacterium]